MQRFRTGSVIMIEVATHTELKGEGAEDAKTRSKQKLFETRSKFKARQRFLNLS